MRRSPRRSGDGQADDDAVSATVVGVTEVYGFAVGDTVIVPHLWYRPKYERTWKGVVNAVCTVIGFSSGERIIVRAPDDNVVPLEVDEVIKHPLTKIASAVRNRSRR